MPKALSPAGGLDCVVVGLQGVAYDLTTNGAGMPVLQSSNSSQRLPLK